MESSGDLVGLLDRARNGDRRALNALLAAIRPRVCRYLRGRTQSSPAGRAVASEVTQDVLLRVAESVDDCRAESREELLGWIHTIARRRLRDWYRRRQEELERREWGPVPRSGSERDPFEEDPEPGTSASAVHRALGRVLVDAQSELSSGTRRVVRRKILLTETWAETGGEIGTTGPGAKRRWQRARPRLKKEILDRVAELPDVVREAVLRRLGLAEEVD